MDAYSTHLHALVKTALTTTGSILELGCGDYSTPVLQEIAKAQGRDYRGQSSDALWAARFLGIEIVDWMTWEPPVGWWGMVFLDSDEKTWDRVKRIPQLKGFTDTIVVHDADIAMQRAGWPEAAKAFPKLEFYKTHQPWTVVMRC